jgi:hypothetical protein
MNPGILADLGTFLVGLSDFEVRSTISSSGESDLLLATHIPSGDPVTLRRFHDDAVDMRQFEGEVRASAAASGPFTVRLIGFSMTPFLVAAEFVPRGSLFDALRHHAGAPRLSG